MTHIEQAEDATNPIHHCGYAMSLNPHPDAGSCVGLNDFGCTYECIPCLIKTRYKWTERTLLAEQMLHDLRQKLAALAASEIKEDG